MSELPMISIVIPNFNCAQFLEATIQSVISQNYPELELIMVDGASTDGSVDIIEKYKEHFAHVVIEPDKGQGDALNKGFKLSSGEIMGWINSDDILLPGALAAVANVFDQHLNVGWITGDIHLIDEAGSITKSAPSRAHSRIRFACGDFRWIQQESTFWRRDLWDAAGGYIDASLKLAVDAELWIRFFRHESLYAVRSPLGAFRIRSGQRSEQLEEYYAEVLAAIKVDRAAMSQGYKAFFKAALDHPLKLRTKEEAAALHPRVAGQDLKPIAEDTPGSGIFKNPNPAQQPTISRIKRRRGPRVANLYDILYKSVDRRGADDISEFRDKHAGERCVIMGNGPSLNKMDMNVFAGETVFAANSIFLLFDRIKWRPTYYSCVDTRVLPDIAPEIEAMRTHNPNMSFFFPKTLSIYDGTGTRLDSREIVSPDPKTWFFTQQNMDRRHLPHSAFSLDANSFLCTPNTVTLTLMQLAFYMGFSDIYLIGCDTSYTVAESVKKEGPTGNDGSQLFLTSTQDDDDNHFDKSYFGAGRKWHSPNVQDMIFHYYQAAMMLEEAGTRVYNATVGGNLEVFPRIDYETVFS